MRTQSAFVSELAQVENLSFDPKRVRIDWTDGHRSVYDALWLRDNCPADRDPRTGQRLVDIADLPEDPSIGAVSHNSETAVLITWSGEAKSTWFPLAWLRDHCYCGAHQSPNQRPPVLWHTGCPDPFLWMAYEEVTSSQQARAQWLRALAGHGIALLRGVPRQDGQVHEVARLIGFVRETNYGRSFDVPPLSTRPHTGSPYLDPVPALQLLHCVQSGEEAGEILLTDGFAVAAQLRTQDPPAFDVLSRLLVSFIFRDDCFDLRAERPLLELHPSGELAAIHYNSRAIAPLCVPSEELAGFYRAYRAFSRLLHSREFEFRVPFTGGDLVAFNNRRVLHGRTEFPASGSRWLQGCYVDSDGLRSHLAILERKRAVPA